MRTAWAAARDICAAVIEEMEASDAKSWTVCKLLEDDVASAELLLILYADEVAVCARRMILHARGRFLG